MPIQKGYVAFGDSYGAGIGTGVTGKGGCRRGSHSYPQQLAAMAGPDIDFQFLPCSGAVVGEILQGGKNSQIDSWRNPENADIATISIGGNDIGFFPILNACVLRVNEFRSGNCDDEIQKAQDMMNGRDLFTDISTALRQIIDKSGRTDFKVYMTGYPAFFNVDTDSCDYTSFYFWQPGHHAFHFLGNWAYLLKARRLQLNNLVGSLNSMLSQVATSVNAAYPSQRVTFLDPNPSFDGHRFCEKDNGKEVTEPDASRSNTWLFLSAWDDNNLPNTATALESANEDLAVFQAGNTTPLPDPNTCSNTTTGDNDWYDDILCGVAQAVLLPPPADDPGPNNASAVFQHDQEALTAGDFNAQEVSYFIPTRQAKTFHPRTLGQKAYKALIMSAW